MSLLVFQHHENEGPSVLGTILQQHGHKLRVVHLYRGQEVPPDLDDVDGVLTLGGPMNVDEAGQHPWIDRELAFLEQAFDARIPIVGICLGAQLLAKALGGEVAPMPTPEAGWQQVRQSFPGTIDPIYGGIPWNVIQFHLHAQEITRLPAGAAPLAGSKLCKIQAFRVGLRTYGFQYHFEWNVQDIRTAAQDPLVAQAGEKSETIVAGLEQHYDTYRRLGDRLCNALQMLVFPVEKRPGALNMSGQRALK